MVLARLAAWLEPDRVRVYPAMIATMTVLFYAVSQWLGPGPLDAGGEVIGADFLAFWTGGRMALTGDLAHLYDFEAQGRLQAETIGVGDIGIHPFVSPPFATALYLPFAAASWGIGLAVWTSVSLALVLGSAAWLGKSLLPPGPWALRALAFPPVLAVFLYGQATGWLMLGFSAFVVLLRRGNDLPAGLALGLLAFKPQLLLPWAVWLLVSRRFSALFGLSLGVAAWLAVGEAVAPGMLPAFVEAAPRVVEMLRSPDYHGWGLANLFGFWLFLTDPISPRLTDVLTLLSSLALGGYVALRWARRRWTESPADDLEIAAAMAIGLVLSPHLFFYDLALLVIPLALALRSLGPRLGGGDVLGATGILYVATFAGPTLSRAIEHATSGAGVRLTILVLVPAILLWAWTLMNEADRAGAAPSWIAPAFPPVIRPSSAGAVVRLAPTSGFSRPRSSKTGGRSGAEPTETG